MGPIENLCQSKGLEMEATMEHLKGQEHSQSQTVHWRIFIFLTILALMGLFCTPRLDAEIYHWVDEYGVKRYSNDPPLNIDKVDIIFREIPFDEATHQKQIEAEQEELQSLIQKLEKEDRQARAEEKRKLEEPEKNQPLSQEELIEAEQKRLRKKIIELEALPFSYFGTESKRRAHLDYYESKLRRLQSNPEQYFSEYQ